MAEESAESKAHSMGKRMQSAIEESKRTGKSVKFSDATSRAAKGKEKKKGKRKKVELGEDTGELDKLLKAKNADSGNLGHFKITEKTFDKELDSYKYEFDWDDNFVAYACQCLNSPEGITVDQMNDFCLSMLIAREQNALEDGVAVRQMKEQEEKKRKFFKKYK